MKALRDWIDVVLKLIITALVGLGTWYLSFQKQTLEAIHAEKVQQNDDIRLVVDMLAIDDVIHRTMALSIAKAYAASRIPVEVYEAANVYVSSRNNNAEAKQTNAVLASIQSSAAGAEAVQKINDTLPIRIYIQYQHIEDKDKVEAIRQKLNGQITGKKSIIVPPTENVKTALSNPELRCFRQKECDDFGKSLIDNLKSAGSPANLQLKLIPGHENSTNIRPYHFEVWFGSLES